MDSSICRGNSAGGGGGGGWGAMKILCIKIGNRASGLQALY